MAYFQGRTDLAVEAREFATEADGGLRGVIVEEQDEEEIHITKVMITSKNGSKAMGKPIGTYVTLDAPSLIEADEGYHREVSRCLARQILELLPDHQQQNPSVDHQQQKSPAGHISHCPHPMDLTDLSVLVVGLGNRDVTADALGPCVVDHLMITRHMIKQFGKAAYEKDTVSLSGIVPGVMGKTGMETAEIVKGVVKETSPDIVIVVDALAARNTKRLTRTIQITNTGIHPGSGVGNHRDALTSESLGIPVIAIGIPTVVDAATIVNDAVRRISRETKNRELSMLGDKSQTLLELNNMYVTSKDIDATIKRLSFTVSEGLNLAFIGQSKKN